MGVGCVNDDWANVAHWSFCPIPFQTMVGADAPSMLTVTPVM
jgi:hypothetical protein